MAERLIVAMTGLAQSGKDTVGDHLVKTHGFARDAFADDLRQSLYAINPPVINPTDSEAPFEMLVEYVDRVGWDQARNHPQVHGMLQRAGTEGGWMIHGERLWIDRVEARMLARPTKVPLVITDCRTQQEVDWVRAHGGVIFRVDRVGQVALDSSLAEHPAEATAIQHDFMIVNNDSLASLRAQVDAVLDMAVQRRLRRR